MTKKATVKKQCSTKIRHEPFACPNERATLMTALQKHVQRNKGTQSAKAVALGITQPRLNDLLKNRIDKFSLDALVSIAIKAGLRVDINLQPVRISPTPEQQRPLPALGHPRPPFMPLPSQLGELDSQAGHSVFHSLLRCEAIANGLDPKDIVLSSNINAADGGIDAKVEHSPASGSLLAKGSTYFQIKTGTSFKPWQPSALKKELFGGSNASPSKISLGDEIKTCLDRDGTYVLVTFGHDLTPKAHTEAFGQLVGLFEACGYESPKVRVYGQGQLVGELEKYPSIYLDLTGFADDGLQSVKAWQNNTQMRVTFEFGSEQENFIREIRTSLQGKTFQHIRIIGEPGIGKTRLALEAVSVDEIAPSIIYVPTGEDFQRSKLFKELLKPDRHYSVTLVVDDCDNRDMASIWSALKGRAGIKLITIDHGPEETHDSAMKIFHCPQLPDEQIKNILLGYLRQKADLDNWAKWCSGSPRIAHAVGENLKSNPGDLLKSPADVPIWDRFITGHKEMGSQEAEQHRTVLRHIALFHRFGFESPVHGEARFISGLVKEVDPAITWGRFQAIVQHYRGKRILQGRHTLFIAPKLLHVYLWAQFWHNHGHGFQFQAFLEQVPDSMKRWFMQLFIYAGEASEAQCVVKDILSPAGPFSDQGFLKSEAGSRFLNYLSEADPAATLALLERTIKTWSREELYAWDAGRQDIVWALEKIAVWDELFVRTTTVLIPMALAENADEDRAGEFPTDDGALIPKALAENTDNSNNAKGLLLSLFSVGLGWAPTQANPSKRFPILKELVMSDDVSRRDLGLEMCERWLKTHGGFREIGAEYQGLKPTIEFWRPRTYGEVFGYWRPALQFLRAETKGFNTVDRNRVADILVIVAQGFMGIDALADEVLDILFELTEDKEINRQSLTRFVVRQLHKNKDTLDKKILARIRQLDQVLTGASLWERTNRYVLHTSWEEDGAFHGEEYRKSKLPGKRVRDLAREYMRDIAVFSEYAPKLVREAGHRLLELGNECGKLAEIKFDDVLMSHIETGNIAINDFFGGYFAGLRARDAGRWENLLHRLLHSETTRRIAVDCIQYSGFTESLMRDMLVLFKDGRLESRAFALVFRLNKVDLSDNLFQRVIAALLHNADDASISICIQLVHDYYFDEGPTGDFPEDLVFKALTTFPLTDNNDTMHGFYWDMMAKGFLKKHPHRSVDLFNEIMRGNRRSSHYDNTEYIANVADDIVKNHPHETWKIVSDLLVSESGYHYELEDWLGNCELVGATKRSAISYMPAGDIIHWIKEDIKNRQGLIRNVLPKTLDMDAGGRLTRLFIEEFCDDASVGDSLCWHFFTGGWNGPESDYLSGKRDAARQWMPEISSTKIQTWLGKYLEYLDDRIETAKIREEREF